MLDRTTLGLEKGVSHGIDPRSHHQSDAGVRRGVPVDSESGPPGSPVLPSFAGRLAGRSSVFPAARSLQRRQRSSPVDARRDSLAENRIVAAGMELAELGPFRQTLAGRHDRRHRQKAAVSSGSGHLGDLGRPSAQTTQPSGQLPWVRHSGFPRRRSPLRDPPGPARSRPGRPRQGNSRDPRHHFESHGRRLGLFAARRGTRQVRQRAGLSLIGRGSMAAPPLRTPMAGGSRGAM